MNVRRAGKIANPLHFFYAPLSRLVYCHVYSHLHLSKMLLKSCDEIADNRGIGRCL